MIYQYKYKFYLNSSHYIVINNNNGETHSHCFELAIDIAATDNKKFTKFNDIEERIEKLLDAYQDKVLNDIPPFNVINPTIENICEYFKCIIASNLAEIGWVILTVEMSETPSRSYIINAVEEMENVLDSELEINDFAEDEEYIDLLSETILPKVTKKESSKKSDYKLDDWDIDVPDDDDFDIPNPEKMYWDIA